MVGTCLWQRCVQSWKGIDRMCKAVEEILSSHPIILQAGWGEKHGSKE